MPEFKPTPSQEAAVRTRGADILVAGDSLNSIRVWNREDASEIFRGYGHTGTIAALYFDLDKGELLSGGFDTTVRFWPFLKQ